MILIMRQNNTLKGRRPAVVRLLHTVNNIYEGSSRKCVISISDKNLYFQGLKKVFNTYSDKYAITLKIEELRTVEIKHENTHDLINIYTKDRKYISFISFTRVQGAYESMVNLDYIISVLKDKGVKVSGA